MFDIALHPRAIRDIFRNAQWMQRNYDPQAASRWHAGIGAAIDSLASRPDRCPEADEAADLGLDLRMLLYGRRRHTFRILFTIDGQTVTVHRVLHAAQDRLTPEDLDPESV